MLYLTASNDFQHRTFPYPAYQGHWRRYSKHMRLDQQEKKGGSFLQTENRGMFCVNELKVKRKAYLSFFMSLPVFGTD